MLLAEPGRGSATGLKGCRGSAPLGCWPGTLPACWRCTVENQKTWSAFKLSPEKRFAAQGGRRKRKKGKDPRRIFQTSSSGAGTYKDHTSENTSHDEERSSAWIHLSEHFAKPLLSCGASMRATGQTSRRRLHFKFKPHVCATG